MQLPGADVEAGSVRVAEGIRIDAEGKCHLIAHAARLQRDASAARDDVRVVIADGVVVHDQVAARHQVHVEDEGIGSGGGDGVVTEGGVQRSTLRLNRDAVVALHGVVQSEGVVGHHQPVERAAGVEDAERVVEGAIERIVVEQGRPGQSSERYIALTVERAELGGGSAIPTRQRRCDDRVSQREPADGISMDAVALNVMNIHVIERDVRGRFQIEAVPLSRAIGTRDVLDRAAAAVASDGGGRAGYVQSAARAGRVEEDAVSTTIRGDAVELEVVRARGFLRGRTGV